VLNHAKPPSAAVAAAPAREDRNLLSTQSDAAVSGAFNALAHTILAQNARTLEDVVVDLLRPMLSDWLDDNLPPLVERLVREEIERVSRGRR
jgi:cell pole-organizing protein PopZ